MAPAVFVHQEAGFYRMSSPLAGRPPVLWFDAAAAPRSDLESLTFGPDTEVATGLYLFLGEAATDLGRLRSQILRLRSQPAYGPLRFLWLQNPNERLARWQFEGLTLTDGIVTRLATFDLGGYSLALPRQSVLEQTATGWRLTAPDAYLTTDYGAQRLGGVDETIHLDLDGDRVGCWRFSLSLQMSAAGEVYAELAALDIGFRLFFTDPLFSTGEIAAKEKVYQSQRYPLFEETASGQSFHDGAMALEGCWAPLDCDRSFFHFPLHDSGKAQPLPSGYRTNLGYTVYLTPQPDSRLVFALKPASSLRARDLYLVPAGEFELTVPRRSGPAVNQIPDFNNNLMCGLSGVEYVKISDRSFPEHFFLELRLLENEAGIPKQVPESQRPLVLVAKIDASYHLCVFNRSGTVSQINDQTAVDPDSLVPGLGAKLDALFADAAAGTPLMLSDTDRQELLELVVNSISYALEFLALDAVAALPKEGERTNLLLLAKIGQDYHARLYDRAGVVNELNKLDNPIDPDSLRPGLRAELDRRLRGASLGTPVSLDFRTKQQLFEGLTANRGYLLKPAASYIGFEPRQPAFAAGYTPAQELILRLRELVGSAQPFDTLEDLLGGDNRGEAIDIFETLKQEFLPQGYQLSANERLALSEFVRSEIATLGEFEQWFQELLSLSRSRPGASSKAPSLTGEATTAWAYLRRDLTDAVYYAQPDQSILYKPSGTPNLFSFLEVSTTDLTLADAPGKFPMLPYGSIASALGDCRQLELQVVNPLRRAQIQIHYEQAPQSGPGIQALGAASTFTTAAVVDQATKQGTTPQGLLATFTEDERLMTELILARSRTTNDQDQFLKLLNIERGAPLWSALRANQLLLIVDDAESLADYFDEPDTLGAGDKSHTQLTIAGWTFFFDTLNDDDEPRWRPDSVLIFKFHDKPLLELIEQPSAWSQVETFVGNDDKVAEVRRRLRDCFEDAISKDTDDTDPKTRKRYAPLANIARNPAWSGIVGINIPVPAGEGLPPALKALAGGIKDENFFARYVGIDNTPVRSDGQVLEVKASSLFGLIDYADDQPPPPHDSGYNFQVLSLRVLFENSVIADFASEIAVTLDRLFEERTELQEDNEILDYPLELVSVDFETDIPSRGRRKVIVADLGRHYHVRIFDGEGQRIVDKGRGLFLPDGDLTRELEDAFQDLTNPPSRKLLGNITASLGRNRSGRNLVKLQGSSENHNGKPTYAFSFSGSNRFLMPNSAVLNYVNIVKAQFSSDPIPPSDASDGAEITGRFSFWAEMGFRQLKKFDAFSFGPTEELPTEDDVRFKRFLRASNLVVTLSFFQKKPQERDFAFISDNVQFEDLPKDEGLGKKLDLTSKSYRSKSLYARFPITLTGFTQGRGKPKGFLPVKTPFGNVSLGADTDWYGMAFDLDLGSLGGLSSITKLVTKLVIVWIPNQNVESDTRPEPSVYVGMQLPGLSGDVMGFSLQSVLKLSFKTAEFLYNQSDGTYLLKLKAIVLKLLVLSLPPNGQTELLIFGNSEGRNQPIGWYAAYAKEPTPPP